MAQRAAVPLGSPADLFQNFATDEKLAQKARQQVETLIKRARRNRIKLDEKNRRRYNMWSLMGDEQFYRGRANAYLPAVRKGIERLCTASIRETFPSDEWWGASANAEEFEPNVAGMKALMSVQLKSQMQLKRKARPFYRQLFLYGTSPVKVPWRVESENEPWPVVGEDGAPKIVQRMRMTYDGPDFEPVDFFSFFMYPETAQDVTRCRLVFEDIITEYDEIADDPNYANLDQAKRSAGSGASGSEALIKRQERLRRLGITEDELNDENFIFLTECYTKFDFEDGMGRLPAILTLAWESIVVRLQRNPYGRPPYFVGKDCEMVDEGYGHTRLEQTDRLQILVNDAANQDFDAASFANNPLVVVDPNYCEDYQSIALFPGAKIPAPPEAVKFDRPPDAAYGQKEKIAFLWQMIGDCLGAPASVSPSPAASAQPRGARTLGGMQLLQSIASSDTKEIVEFQEDLVFEPMLAWIAKLNAMFLSDDRILRTAGAKGAAVTVNRASFEGDYAYEWLGTETVRNQTLLSAQMLIAMNVLRGVPPSMGIPNVRYIMETWWTAQGLKNPDRLFLGTPPESVEPQIEHELLMVGRKIQVSPLDNDAQHVIRHEMFLRTLEPGSPEGTELAMHVQEHQASAVHKAMAQQMAMLQAQTPQLPAMPQGWSAKLVGQVPPGAAARATGQPEPAGARAGQSPNGAMSPTSGNGPLHATMAGG